MTKDISGASLKTNDMRQSFQQRKSTEQQLTKPATRFFHCGIDIEDVFKVIQTEHLLVQCIKLDAARKVGQSKRGRGLKKTE